MVFVLYVFEDRRIVIVLEVNSFRRVIFAIFVLYCHLNLYIAYNSLGSIC